MDQYIISRHDAYLALLDNLKEIRVGMLIDMKLL